MNCLLLIFFLKIVIRRSKYFALVKEVQVVYPKGSRLWGLNGICQYAIHKVTGVKKDQSTAHRIGATGINQLTGKADTEY